MESATRQGSLQQLAQRLQRVISLPYPTPVQVQCAVRQGSLMVLAQHPPGGELEPELVFGQLQQAIQAMSPTELAAFAVPVVVTEPNKLAENRSISADSTEPAVSIVKLYLRMLGQKHPYASHSFKFLPKQEPDELFARVGEAAPKPPDSIEPEELPASDDASTLAERLILMPEPEAASTPTYSVFKPKKPTPLPGPARVRSQSLPWLALGIASGVVILVAGMLALARPCVLGQCEPLQTAQSLSQQSTQTLQTARSDQELKQAQQQLAEADRLLDSIPPWSPYHGAAATLQQSYRSQAETLNQLLEAIDKADGAIQKSQTLPQSVADWQGIQSSLQTAIGQLQALPESNSLHSFAQQRLATYQQNLAIVNQNITAEQQSQKTLKAAKDTAKIAEARQGAAQSLETWQQARVTWQVAVNALQRIPNSTTSYSEAQQLLADYEQKLVISRNKATQEQISQKTYTQAINLAQRAQGLEKQNQWFQAVSAWRDALSYAKQVPNETLYYPEIQPKVAEYTTALKNAETRLQALTALQKIRTDLNNVCAGTPKICSYTIAKDSIQLQLTSAYERAVRTAFVLGRAGDRATLGGAVNHLETLETALQTISNNAGVPLVVYNADGSETIGSFVPRNQ